MTLFNFSLTLAGVTSETSGLEDALYASGCDDGLICFYGKSVYIEFDRESDSFTHAILSAIKDIESAGIGAQAMSVDSYLVGLSDIAQLTGMSRQAIAMLKDGTRGSGDFPPPSKGSKGPPHYGTGTVLQPGWQTRVNWGKNWRITRNVWRISIWRCSSEPANNAAR